MIHSRQDQIHRTEMKENILTSPVSQDSVRCSLESSEKMKESLDKIRYKLLNPNVAFLLGCRISDGLLALLQ